MMRLFMGLLVAIAVSGCGGSSCPPAGEFDAGQHADAGAVQCDAQGRTCDSAFGVFTLTTTGPAGCSTTSLPRDLVLSTFDGGVGTATWTSQSPLPITRSGCQYVGRYSASSSMIEFTYDSACNTLRGRVQLNAPACNQPNDLAWFDVVGRKP